MRRMNKKKEKLWKWLHYKDVKKYREKALTI